MNVEQKDAGHHGFILGILIGILLTLLFTTRKGRKLLKTITTEGSRKFNSWDDLITILESEIGDSEVDEKESVVGEDIDEEIDEAELLKKDHQMAQIEKEEKTPKIDDEEELMPETPSVSRKIEKIDTKHLEQEISELKEELKEVKSEKIEDNFTSSGQEEKPKSKSRFFKGIRRK